MSVWNVNQNLVNYIPNAQSSSRALVERGSPTKSIVLNSKIAIISSEKKSFVEVDIRDLISDLITKGQKCPSSSEWYL